MCDEKYASHLSLKSIDDHTSVVRDHGWRAAQSGQARRVGSNVERCTSLTAREEECVGALFEHMLRVAQGASKSTEAHQEIYFDSGFAYEWDGKDGMCTHGPGKLWGHADELTVDLGPALCRVGMAAADRYRVRAFGRPFDDIPKSGQKHVLGVLDRIKCVFPDGSQAGVFFAAVHQTVERVPERHRLQLRR